VQSGRQSAQVGRQPTSARGHGKQEDSESADKPGSVVRSHSSGTCVTACLMRPTRGLCGPHVVLLFGLAPDGVYRAANRCRTRGALLPHPFTLAGPVIRVLGGLLSVALSVGSRPPGVTWHPALWSPDFPPCPQASTATAWPTPSAGVYHPEGVNGGSPQVCA